MGWRLCGDPGTLTTVVTANGEVQTNDEAQVYVLDLFVTMQLLDDTPAVLSLGKLCDQHGNIFEWVSGKHPRLTKQGKNIACKTEISYLWSFLDCRVHLLHRHRRTRQVHQQVHDLVQLRSEVVSSHQKTGRGIPQGIQKIRMTVCKIFQNGRRSSQKISKTH